MVGTLSSHHPQSSIRISVVTADETYIPYSGVEFPAARIFKIAYIHYYATMGFIRPLLFTTFVATPPAIYVYSTIIRLEREYDRLDPLISSTTALRTPSSGPGSFHTPHIDVYGTKVPAKLLASRQTTDGRALSPEEAWALFFLQSPTLRLEGKLFGGFIQGPGDLGEGGFRVGQKLLNGMFEIVTAPAEPARVLPGSMSQSTPLLVRWEFPPQGVALYRKAAGDWGFPFRMMSGGRHEISLGNVDEEGMVEVRFASAHDYEWIPEEGMVQKVQPKWVGRLHRAFAMWLLDERARALKKDP